MADKLSVCIVAYNNYDDIKAVISLMKEKTSQNLEYKIYIVDNGSVISNPLDVIRFKKYIAGLNDIKYIDAGGNRGFAKGHNQILDIIDSEYHAIVNPDILFYEDVFSSIIEYMNKNSDVGMVIPDIRDESGKRQDRILGRT